MALPGDPQRLGGDAQVGQVQRVHQAQGGEHRLEQLVCLVPGELAPGVLNKAPQGHGGHRLVHGVGGVVLLEDVLHRLDHADLPQAADALGQLHKVVQVPGEGGVLPRLGQDSQAVLVPEGQRHGEKLPDLHRLFGGKVQGRVGDALAVSRLGPADLVPSGQHRMAGQPLGDLGPAVVPAAHRAGLPLPCGQGGKTVCTQSGFHSVFSTLKPGGPPRPAAGRPYLWIV